MMLMRLILFLSLHGVVDYLIIIIYNCLFYIIILIITLKKKLNRYQNRKQTFLKDNNKLFYKYKYLY